MGEERTDRRWGFLFWFFPSLLAASVLDRVKYWADYPQKNKKKKTALEIRGLMSQSWMMTIMSDSLFPRKHAQGSPEHTCSF